MKMYLFFDRLTLKEGKSKTFKSADHKNVLFTGCVSKLVLGRVKLCLEGDYGATCLLSLLFFILK